MIVSNTAAQAAQVECGASAASAARPLAGPPVRRCRVFWISRCRGNEKKPSLKKPPAVKKQPTAPAPPPPAGHSGH